MITIKQISRTFSTKALLKGGLWLIFGTILLVISNESPFTWFNISNVLIALAFFYTYVQFNTHYLIPNFLQQRSVITYLLLFITSALILTPLRSLVYYLRFWTVPELQTEVLQSQWFTFLSFLIIGVISTVVKIIWNWLGDLRRMRELEKENLQSELKFLRSQINPHFLFNTLNSLYALTLKKSDSAPQMVIRLSEIMRYMLYDCNEAEVSLEKEIQYMGNYVELERLRYGSDVEINYTLEGLATDQKIAPLLFTPFFENAFKHGLGNRIHGGWIDIAFKVKEELVTLTIGNSIPQKEYENRKFRPSEVKSSSSGIGLENVKRRLKLLYPDNHSLQIKEGTDYFRIILDIKLEQNERN